MTTIFGVERSTLLLGAVPVFQEGGGTLETPASLQMGEPLVFLQVFTTLRNTPRALLRVLAAFFLSYCAFSPFLILDTLWFARDGEKS